MGIGMVYGLWLSDMKQHLRLHQRDAIGWKSLSVDTTGMHGTSEGLRREGHYNNYFQLTIDLIIDWKMS